MKKVNFFGDSFLISYNRVSDDRGYFQKIFSSNTSFNFLEQYFSSSKKNTIRGIHFQLPPYDHDKLVYCVKGKVLDLIIDLRFKSINYMKYKTIILDEKETKALFIPKGFGHGFLSLEDDSILNYSTSTIYNEEYDSGIHWSSLGYDWPVKNPLVSTRDSSFINLQDFKSPF